MKQEKLYGIGLSFLFAAVAYTLGLYYPIIGGPVFGIVLGMIFASVKRPQILEAGISFTGKKILQYAVILLGFEMNLFEVAAIGAKSFSVMIFTLLTAFGVAYLVGKLLKLDRKTTLLIGAGTAICGGSAIAAVAPVIAAKDKEIAFSISTIFLFNVAAVFLFPFLGHYWQLSDTGFGMWAGTAINDTSSVVAAAYSYSDAAGSYATIVKLTRALMIVPICLLLAGVMAYRNKQKNSFSFQRIFPWFILWFVVASLVHTAGVLPESLAGLLGSCGKFAIMMAMSAIGLNTRLVELVKNGVRPILLGSVCWAAVAFASLFVQHLSGLL
ncbi:MAG: putative sulfate exporter family transporter [Sporomusaceae bacterium]|nr:putative sulfate exporter family transporter [Sporomusaceae bacterium]